MRPIYPLFFFLFALLSSLIGHAQIDTEFWFAAPNLTNGFDSPIRMQFSSFSTPSTVTVSQPANGSFAPISFTLAANSTHTLDLTPFIAQVEPTENGYSNFGFLVEATALIQVYYEANKYDNPDIFSLKGSAGLGTDFIFPVQALWGPGAKTGCNIVASVDGTQVTIIPTQEFGAPHPANVPVSVTLNRGQVYNLTSTSNPSHGTTITSSQPIAVTAYQDLIGTGGGSCGDLAGDQLVSNNRVGVEYIVLRGSLSNNEQVVITAVEDNTSVSVDGGTPVLLNQADGHSYFIPGAQPTSYIISNKPIIVAHYAGYGCEGGLAILPPVGACTGSYATSLVRSTNESFSVNIMVETGHETNFTLNGGAPNTDIPATAFSAVSGSGGLWVSAQITFPTSAIPMGGIVNIENSTSRYHLGMNNGGTGTGSRYGYFSEFNFLGLGPDIVRPYGTTGILLEPQNSGGNIISYLWSTGATTSSITVNAYPENTYWLAATLIDGCVIRDTICVGTEEFVWVGTSSADYENPDNWSYRCEDGTPTCADDVVIPAGLSTYPTLNATHEAHNLLLEAGATLNALPTSTFNLCGHFEHQGTINFSPNADFKFIGDSVQHYNKTGGSASGQFMDLFIDQDTLVMRDNHVLVPSTGQNLEVSLQGQLTFEKGHIKTEDVREVVVYNRANGAVVGHATGGHGNHINQNFVDGRIRRYLLPSGNYDFPVGLAGELDTVSTITTQDIIDGLPDGNFSGSRRDNNWWPHYARMSHGGGFIGSDLSTPETSTPLEINLGGTYTIERLATRGHSNSWYTTNYKVSYSTDGGTTWLFYDGAGGAASFAGGINLIANTTGGSTIEENNTIVPFTATHLRFYPTSFNGFPVFSVAAYAQVEELDCTTTALIDGLANANFFSNGSHMNWYPENSKLTYPAAGGGWVPSGFDVSGTYYLDVDLGGSQTVARIATMGHSNGWHTTTYKLAYSNDGGITWSFYDGSPSDGGAATFATATNLIANNTGGSTLQENNSFIPFEATHLRFYATGYSGVPVLNVEAYSLNCNTTFISRYELANVNFQGSTNIDNILCYFDTFPDPTALPGGFGVHCTHDFTCAALNQGFWNMRAFDNSGTEIVGTGLYDMTLHPRGYDNVCGDIFTIARKSALAGHSAFDIREGNCASSTANEILRTDMEGFSQFLGAQGVIPDLLPVELLSFTGDCQNGNVQLRWETATEYNAAYFEVLQRSENTENFVSLAKLPAYNATEGAVYTYALPEAQHELTYYQLRQVDKDGTANYFPVLAVYPCDISGTQMLSSLKLMPNPAAESTHLFFNSQAAGKAKISIFDNLGRQLYFQNVGIEKGQNNIALSLRDLPRGVYFVEVQHTQATKRIKLVVE